jgi:calcineurin-like phosphoesterase family protein
MYESRLPENGQGKEERMWPGFRFSYRSLQRYLLYHGTVHIHVLVTTKKEIHVHFAALFSSFVET